MWDYINSSRKIDAPGGRVQYYSSIINAQETTKNHREKNALNFGHAEKQQERWLSFYSVTKKRMSI